MYKLNNSKTDFIPLSFPTNKEEVQTIIINQINKIITLYEQILNSEELSNLNHHLRNYVSSICSKVTTIIIKEELCTNTNINTSIIECEFKLIMSKLIQIELYSNKQKFAKVLMEKNTISNSETIFNNI